jgi:uncharacterized membrane protein
MYIDNRIFIPFVMPFAVLLLIKLVFWAAGASSDPETVAGVSLVFGGIIGCTVMVVLFEERISLGGFYIGKRGGGE